MQGLIHGRRRNSISSSLRAHPARRMAKDVDAALRKIIQYKGGKSEEQTNE
jgi:hypothetical protein